MAPPSSTPSPHRFIVKPGSSTVKQASRLRFCGDGFSSEAGRDVSDETLSREQFASAPRFTAKVPKSSNVLEIDDSFTTRPSASTRSLVFPKQAEAIEDESQEEYHDQDEMLIETNHQTEEVLEEPIPASKRQRIGESDYEFTPHRFTVPSVGPSQASASLFTPDEASAARIRPAFRLPPQETATISQPLPDAFSPYRRGQRFIPGGMATEAQQWVIETAQSFNQQRNAASENVTHVSVVEASNNTGDGMILVKGESDHRLLNLLLVPYGMNIASPDVNQGDILAIRAPTWQIKLVDEIWVVAADWKHKS